MAAALVAALILGIGLVLYNSRPRDLPPSSSGDGYPVGEAPRRAADHPPGGDRLRRLEGQYLTGVGQVIHEGRLKKDNPQIEMDLLHEMANCPLLVTAMKYHLPLYVTVRNGRFAGDADGKFYDAHKLCGQCVK